MNCRIFREDFSFDHARVWEATVREAILRIFIIKYIKPQGTLDLMGVSMVNTRDVLQRPILVGSSLRLPIGCGPRETHKSLKTGG